MGTVDISEIIGLNIFISLYKYTIHENIYDEKD